MVINLELSLSLALENARLSRYNLSTSTLSATVLARVTILENHNEKMPPNNDDDRKGESI